MSGRCKVNDDEWYTPYDTAIEVARFLREYLDEMTPILCPADILPDGQESTIPRAMRDIGFQRVRVTRNLPVQDDGAWMPGEVVVTNPPFSLLVPFREFVKQNNIKYCVLNSNSRRATMRGSWPIRILKDNFRDELGRTVAASWQQNIANTEVVDERDSSNGKNKFTRFFYPEE